jgi:peptide/nickel transport system permease protein
VPLAFLYMMFTVTAAIFSEAILSFFGILNIRMSWGIMINTAQVSGYLGFGLDYWWLLIPAGVSITLLCGSFYLVGRGLDPVVNPRLRAR